MHRQPPPTAAEIWGYDDNSWIGGAINTIDGFNTTVFNRATEFLEGIKELALTALDLDLYVKERLLSAFGIDLDLPEFSAIGQALKEGVTVQQLLYGIGEALAEVGVDIGTLGGSIINDYRLGRINEDEFSRRMLDLGLTLLGGAGAIKKFGSVANALKYALKKSKKIAKEIVEDVKHGKIPTIILDAVEGTGRLGGNHYGTEKLGKLGRYLERRGVTLKVGDEFLPRDKGGIFIAHKNGGAELILRSNPTKYEVWHELSHYIQWKRIGSEAYRGLPRWSPSNPVQSVPEQFVFDLLENSKDRRWNLLTFEEQQHAIDYILRQGGFR